MTGERKELLRQKSLGVKEQVLCVRTDGKYSFSHYLQGDVQVVSSVVIDKAQLRELFNTIGVELHR